MSKIWRIIDIINWAEKYFSQNQFTNPKLEIEWLLRSLLKCNKLDIYLRFEEPLDNKQLSVLRSWIKRRVKNNEPLQNYRSAYMQLAVTYYMDYQKEKRKKNPDDYILADLSSKSVAVLDQMRFNIPEETIPITSEDLHYQVARLYGDLDRKESMENIIEDLIAMEGVSPSNKVEYANVYYRELDDPETAVRILSDLQNEYSKIENMVKIKGLSSISSNSWKKWQKAFPDIVSSLVYIYKSTNQNNEAEGVLIDWISRFPNDSNAKKLLEEVRNPD